MGDAMQVLGDQSTQERGDNARLSSFIGAIAVGDLIKSTLGPKGMDKLLIPSGSGGSNEPIVTNDGATILKNIMLDNAAAKVLVNVSKTQDDEIGDGTTSVTILAAELLRQADMLIQQMKMHPQIIIKGYRMAAKIAVKTLEENAINNKENTQQFKKDLINIAKTTLSSKILNKEKEMFAKLATEAILRLNGSTDLDLIQIIKKEGGQLKESFLDDGFILNKEIGSNQPKKIENAKILIANTSLDSDKVKIFGAKIKTNSTKKLADLEQYEKKKMENKVNKIIAHDINVFINRQLIYNYPEMLFAQNKIMAIEHADFDGIERLSKVFDCEVASTFDDPKNAKLGHCDLIEECLIGDEKMIRFKGIKSNNKAVAAMTIVLFGSSSHILDEAERSLHDALCVLSQTANEPRIVYGGGCSEILMAKAVEELAAKTPGKIAFAITAFANALIKLPTYIADNAGYDSADLIAQLKSCHYKNNNTAGLNMDLGIIDDMKKNGITEAFKLKKLMVLSASEAAEMIVRVDDILRCAPRKRERV